MPHSFTIPCLTHLQRPIYNSEHHEVLFRHPRCPSRRVERRLYRTATTIGPIDQDPEAHVHRRGTRRRVVGRIVVRGRRAPGNGRNAGSGSCQGTSTVRHRTNGLFRGSTRDRHCILFLLHLTFFVVCLYLFVDFIPLSFVRRRQVKRGKRKGSSAPTAAAAPKTTLAPEETFYEGPPAISETIVPTISILTVIGIIPAAAAWARQAWVRYKITNRRIRVTSGFGGNEMAEIVYPDIVEIRTAKRLFGDGDMVAFLRDGGKNEIKTTVGNQ